MPALVFRRFARGGELGPNAVVASFVSPRKLMKSKVSAALSRAASPSSTAGGLECSLRNAPGAVLRKGFELRSVPRVTVASGTYTEPSFELTADLSNRGMMTRRAYSVRLRFGLVLLVRRGDADKAASFSQLLKLTSA
eukprot:s2692_g10.t1